jgi:hypothetical protein
MKSSNRAPRVLLAVIPAKAGIQRLSRTGRKVPEEQSHWIPAFAGMTAESNTGVESTL